MSAENNQFKIDHAYPGICSLCHTEIAEFNGSHKSGLPILTKFKENKREAQIKLSDNSVMTVLICKDCHENLSDQNLGELMESEINGWAHQINTILRDKWSFNDRVSYMKKYESLTAVGRIDKKLVIERGNIPAPRKTKLKTKVRR